MEDPCGVRVEEDGTVSFTMYAPSVAKVEVAGISGSFPSEKIGLEKDEEGYFRKTVKGIKPGFHYFNWFVDDIRIRDPFVMAVLTRLIFLKFLNPGKIFTSFRKFPTARYRLGNIFREKILT